MAKNHLAKALKEASDKAYDMGVWSGLRMGFDLTAIALNHNFKFGADRITRLESEVLDLMKEISDSPEPALAAENLRKSLKQIMGEDYEIGDWKV